jgi:hypothetical protein
MWKKRKFITLPGLELTCYSVHTNSYSDCATQAHATKLYISEMINIMKQSVILILDVPKETGLELCILCCSKSTFYMISLLKMWL